MTPTVIVDTGPLVALLGARDKYHEWAKQQLSALRPPLMTCEAVIAEACHLVGSRSSGAVLGMISRGVLEASFHLEAHADAVAKLISRYASVPMDLADACIVRMTELVENPLVLTIDEDFLIYRRHGRQRIRTLMPPR